MVDKKVPRGKRRFSLQEGGFIVSFVEFWTNWTEREVHTHCIFDKEVLWSLSHFVNGHSTLLQLDVK